MASVIACINLSHSPFWNIAPAPVPSTPGGHFTAAVDELRHLAASLAPDAVVVFGPDHARGLFYDLMPPFTIGVERVQGIGDYDTPSGDLPVAVRLAGQVFTGVTRRGFDPAISLDLRIDHGLTQVYGKLFPHLDVPLLPIVINSGCPPLPSFSRAWAFGAAVGAAIRDSDTDGRVLVVGSGGLSHWPNSTSALDPSITDEWRDFLIRGRDRVTALEPARRERLEQIAAGEATGYVNADWDLDVLTRMTTDARILGELDVEDVERAGGPGAHELRTWAAATAAWGGPLEYSCYEAVPEWITGMGISASHDPASVPVDATA
ncbi:2,3-dihydroxyphenylpropionate 1,2-dioxygenase [Streptomyces sioyaensis]|uniref:DODA-type extradiol aromatic ring-opening family dioxygenase n=1 Tax=Streptomyces sioyaensis TaxID=67364 RepID=UPI0036A0B089